MFKQLQMKFLWRSTLILFLVIAAVTGAVYWITSCTLQLQTRVLTEMILDNGGNLPERIEFKPEQTRFLALNGESPYETRFISAKETDENLEIITVHIAVLNFEDAGTLAQNALSRRASVGRIAASGSRIFNYEKRTESDGSTIVVVLDSTSRYSMQRLIMTYMAALWLIVLSLYIIVMSKYSRKLIQPFIENDERQKRFVTNASHELKTPLAIISANTEMAEAMGGKTKWTESTRRQISRLQMLIEDLVVLSRADEMKEEDMTNVDLSSVISETAESFRDLAESSGYSFLAEIVPDIHVTGDRRSLQHVASILIENAIKYCDSQGSINVKLEERQHNKGGRLTVSNTYAEGKDTDFSRFFERFYRHDESHNSDKAGFGIGLSMAKEIIERMKGKIRITYAGDIISFIVEI